MELLEKEIEDFFIDELNDGGGNLSDRGFELPCFLMDIPIKWYRQVNIEPYGICDIVGVYRFMGCIYVEIIELKRVKIDVNHFEQIMRYKKGFEVYLRNTLRRGGDFEIKLHLVGVGYDGLYIQNELPINVYSMSYDLNGINFLKSQKYTGWMVPSGKNKSFRNG